MNTESYIYKKEVDWSVLTAGITLPVDNQVVFGQIAGRFLQRGERKAVKLFLDGETFDAIITNVKFSEKYKNSHKTDILQLRYSENSALAIKLRQKFASSYQFLVNARSNRDKGDRRIIKIPDELKEYLALYTTEYDDTYILDTIVVSDIEEYRTSISQMSEIEVEREYNIEKDLTAGIVTKQREVKIRKLNRAISDNLKLLYGYRCQICGKLIGEEYGAHIAEAHHIEYFIHSLNNDASNQLIVCPNHHRIIHSENPDFLRGKLAYVYPNGYEERLKLNLHL